MDVIEEPLRVGGERFVQEGLKLMKEISKIPDAEDTPEFWSRSIGVFCAYPEETKKEIYSAWSKAF
ncbi:hypothetical protein NPIL_634251, partial [Nephila pilipes]